MYTNSGWLLRYDIRNEKIYISLSFLIFVVNMLITIHQKRFKQWYCTLYHYYT